MQKRVRGEFSETWFDEDDIEQDIEIEIDGWWDGEEFSGDYTVYLDGEEIRLPTEKVNNYIRDHWEFYVIGEFVNGEYVRL